MSSPKSTAKTVKKDETAKPATKTVSASKKSPAKTGKTVSSKETKNVETKEKPATKTEKTSTAKSSSKQEQTKSETVEKTKKPVYRVLFDKESRLWLIKKDGAKRTIASFATKEEALERVKELSSSNELNFVVHKKDGKFQKK